MMKKGRESDNILDECLERLLVKGETIEECLASYPQQADELKPLLQTALAAKKAVAIQPRPEFRAKARYQFRSALQEVESKRGRPFFGWQRRWVTAVTMVLILLLVGSGTVATASNSMPDEPLYQVKLITEQARLTLTPSALGKAELSARLADKRVTEIIYVANKGDPERVELVTQHLHNRLAMIERLVAAQREEGSVLMAPREGMKDDTRVYQQINGGRARLRMMLARAAVNNPDALRAILKTAPESAKPALRQAIMVAVASYERALEAVE